MQKLATALTKPLAARKDKKAQLVTCMETMEDSLGDRSVGFMSWVPGNVAVRGTHVEIHWSCLCPHSTLSSGNSGSSFWPVFGFVSFLLGDVWAVAPGLVAGPKDPTAWGNQQLNDC